MKFRVGMVLCAALCASPVTTSAKTADPESAAAGTFCDGLRSAVAAQLAGSDAVFIRSYQAGADEANLPDGLKTTAFVYDNALAVIALIACGDLPGAKSVGNALHLATRSDRTFDDGRVRNAYRAGPVGERPPNLPGWWDARANIWAEDPAQDGTSTGNIAWGGLGAPGTTRSDP